ncbi:hypothetical protein EKE94_16315 [Mesobaculum littorinae]|uniref:Uncharacterized protein n=1 Tax=Mesobaculum littorinae TaxID=2486419 RepID=A0A438ADX1_9RHOB|nr:DUF6638 family protein [Mesobaculum littorinae]RVV96906.1 hypothetical protein EKE94_16315 [Mesobaculum littorinae]
MRRLIDKGLMFGNLVPVTSPALVDRYNRALEHLTGRRTALTDFHIDLSGYSPEIGDEFEDELYLNPNGCNRQFILLSTSQKRAPLLNMDFTTSRPVLKGFIEENESALFALTAQDAVAGELSNSVFDVSRPSRLLDIRRITVEADTTRAHVADARRLQERIDRFRSQPMAWADEALVAEMIALASRTGDVTRNPVTLDRMVYDAGNFWTAHFGGAYLFHHSPAPFAIAADPAPFAADPGIGFAVFGTDRAEAIARTLAENDLIEPIARARGADAAAILRQKMDFILIDAAATLELDLGQVTRRDLRGLARRLGPALPDAFLGLADLLRGIEGGGPMPRIGPDHPAYFYTLRAAPGPDRDLVNMALAELAPLDVRQLFICHKELFYRRYATWSEPRRSYVADFLAAEYQVDKAGARAALFGPEPGMDTPEGPATRRPDPQPAPETRAGPWGRRPAPRRGREDKEEDRDLIARVGPWGAVRR